VTSRRLGVEPWLLLSLGLLAASAASATAQDRSAIPILKIARAAGQIQLDGDLSDPGWQGATPVETWFEVNPGDNLPAKIVNRGFLAYDERYLYAGFEFQDPDPGKIRAPLGDRDNLPGSTDYAGIIVDTRNDRRTGILFLANARGIQYDAVSDDGGSGEDSSPDFYWDAAGRVTKTGWTLEMRIPFSSLRYPKADVQKWGIMLYRNYPREFRYQFFSTRLPRDVSCFICNSNALEGLSGLPGGGHLVAAPYVNASRTALPAGGLGTPLQNGPAEAEAGLDVKWTPAPGTAIDATLNPDFSQIESDVAQISANERFALFYPEKRPFFLEGIELFSTPFQAVYTRTITTPRFGVRGTGKAGALAFTGLLADDRGGGSVILPGPNGSGLADDNGHSYVALGRARRDFGRSFVSLLASDREREDDSWNRVAGPDFQWRHGKADIVTGQLLWSFSRTPDRPDQAPEWDGRSLSGHASDLWWSRSTATYDWFGEYRDVSDGFRADNGFVPQVGYRSGYAETGYTFRPTKGLVRRLRTYLMGSYSEDRASDQLGQEVSPGFGLDARWNTFLRVRWSFDRARAGEGTQTLPRSRLFYTLQTSPSRFLSQITLDGTAGRDIDFANARPGTGVNATLSATLRPSDHLELRINEGRRWLNVDAPDGSRARLFTARVDRVRATYTLNRRAFVRAIAQYVSTRRDPALYASPVAPHDAAFNGSVLVAYKLNWQTVLFAGYGDEHALSEAENLEPAARSFFVKLSYAFQR
jgi:hypothetical protein